MQANGAAGDADNVTITPTELPEVLLITSEVFGDDRGWFQEIWNCGRVPSNDLPTHFVQDNLAFSRRGVLRGLHFQEPHAQGKLVTAVKGEIFDVAVDIRPGSATLGCWAARRLVGGSGSALYIPPGFAHGYQALSDEAYVLYKCTEVYHPECERTIAWNDPEIGIPWPLANPIVSAKDRGAPPLSQLNRR